MEKKRKFVLGSEYSVKVNFGMEKLEECIERLVEDMRKNMKEHICNSGKDSL